MKKRISSILCSIIIIFIILFSTLNIQFKTYSKNTNLQEVLNSSTTKTPTSPIDTIIKEPNMDYVNVYSESNELLQPYMNVASYGYTKPKIIALKGVADQNTTYQLRFAPIHTSNFNMPETGATVIEVPYNIFNPDLVISFGTASFYYFINGQFIEINDSNIFKAEYGSNGGFDNFNVKLKLPKQYYSYINKYVEDFKNDYGKYDDLLQNAIFMSVNIHLYEKNNSWNYRVINSGMMPFYVVEGFDSSQLVQALIIGGVILGVVIVCFIIFFIIRRHSYKYKLNIV